MAVPAKATFSAMQSLADPAKAACAGSGDGKSKWMRLSSKWTAEFLLDPACPEAGSWLQEQEQPWGIGCKACSFCKCVGRLAKFRVCTRSGLQSVNFVKHQKSKVHQNSVKMFLANGNDSGLNTAPDTSSFKAVLVKIRDCQSTLNSRKEAQMTWCLAEAMKAIDQRRLTKTKSVSLFRDERKGLLAVRFRTVSEDLVVHSGTLGHERCAGTGAANLTQATERIMKRAASRFLNGPGSKKKGWLKVPLYRRLRQSVTTITVDSAADEVVSSELMRTALTPGQKLLTPNLRFVVRDKAHSSRRITSRPWAADEALKSTLNLLGHGPGSIAKLLQHSPEIQRIFRDFAETSDSQVNHVVRNFRAAAHRFESHAKPLGRTLLHLHACIRTALHLVQTRTDKASTKAKNWLLALTEEHCLQAAMMADAADSSLQLTRLMDHEDTDPANLGTELRLYLNTIRGLFCEKRCLTIFGFTRTMLETLKTPIVFQVGRKTRSLGSALGVSEAVQDTCLKRMVAFAHLADAAIRAEFPSFELSQAFEVFDLRSTPQNPEEHLQRIATACKLNFQELHRQWEDIFPRAQVQLKSSGATASKDAWKLALEQIIDRSRGKSDTERRVSALKGALVQYFAFGLSSSGVEQAFSKGAWAFHARRQRASPDKEDFCLKVIHDNHLYHDDEIFQLARVVWQQCYGMPRTHWRPRADKGIKRPLSQDACTEIDFIRKRRREAAEAGAQVRGDIIRMDDLEPEVWTEAHTRELDFQRRKTNARKVQAYAENSLLEKEVDEHVAEQADECKEKLGQNALKRKALQERVRRAQGASASDVKSALQGCRAYLAVPATMQLQSCIVGHGLAETKVLSRADVIICHEPGQSVDWRLQCVSAVRGCYEVSPNFLMHGRGAALKVTRSALLPRVLLASHLCARNADVFKLLREALPSGHRWVISKSELATLPDLQARYRAGLAYIVVADVEMSSQVSELQAIF